MKILLTAINAKYIHSNPAVYSLAAYANYNLTKEEKIIYEYNPYNGMPVLTNVQLKADADGKQAETVIENENFKVVAVDNGIKEIFDKSTREFSKEMFETVSTELEIIKLIEFER